MPRMISPIRFVLTFLFACLVSAQAHPNGTSRVYIHLLENDSLTVEIDANTGDAINAVSSTINPGLFREAETRVYQQQAAHYLFSRLQVQADGRSVLKPQVLLWKRDGTGPDDDLSRDSAALWDTTIALLFGGNLPSDARTLSVSAAIFPEFGVQTLCEVSVFWKDTLIERRWLTLDKVLRMPLAADSLNAQLAATRKAPEAASGGNLFGRFIGLGYTHILPHGLDHILFVVGLFFFSTRMRPLFFQVTAFTVAHSLTLALALLGIFSLPPGLVEPLIALSIAVVGLENIFFRRVKASRWLVVFAFGLIHGMGFAGVLSGLGLPEGGFWPALIGFNVGVEIGQISVIAIVFALTVWFRKKTWYFKGIVVPASLVISGVGLYWFVQRVVGF